MIALNHVLTGTAIAFVVKRPELAIPLAFLSHFVIDAIPHYEYGEPGTRQFWFSWILDAIATTAALVFLCMHAPDQAWLIIASGVSAELPDVFWVYCYARGLHKKWFFAFHKRVQWSETKIGIIPELLYTALIVYANSKLLG
jgi:hypothetical protein